MQVTKREYVWISSDQIEHAQKSFISAGHAEYNMQRSPLLKKGFSILKEGRYTLSFLGRPPDPSWAYQRPQGLPPYDLFYSDHGTFLAEVSSGEAQFFLKLFGIAIENYRKLFNDFGALFLIGTEPEKEKRSRLLADINHIMSTSYGSHLTLCFITGVYISEISVPKDMTESEKVNLTAALLDYQIKIDKQAILAQLTSSKDRRRTFEQFNTCEQERVKLYGALQKLGWGQPQLNSQVYDARYKEWDEQKNEWNISKLEAFFTRVSR